MDGNPRRDQVSSFLYFPILLSLVYIDAVRITSTRCHGEKYHLFTLSLL